MFDVAKRRFGIPSRLAGASGQLLLLTFLLGASGSSLSAQQVEAGTAVLVDANDAVVGSLLTYDRLPQEEIRTVLFVDEEPVVLRAVDGSSLSGNASELFFESGDCTGAGYLAASFADFTFTEPVHVANLPQLSIWLRASDTITTGLTQSSVLGPFGNCVPVAPAVTNGFLAIEVPTAFVPPYRVARLPLEGVDILAVPAVSPLGLGLLGAFIAVGGWLVLRSR
ncbi:MAG: hypothetical protein DWQ36_21575 [Acidobacteria bacterium]|nr:MAG: hypothetical protein DWQ30_09475 [Acidobacteriota bacterium]REK01099.1 MAG: hypothetical protein DWQ36_21575 [Acidobacteriota bacterium]